MRLILSVLVVLFAMNSHAAEPCETCSGEPQYPEAETFLQAHGYAKSDHTVLMSWSERTHDGTNRFVTGFHVKSADGSVFDIYSDGADKLLSNKELKQLGIKPKNWDLKPVEKFGETPPALQRVLPEKPVPTGVSKSIPPRGGAVLPEIDWTEVTREDAERRELGKGPKRIGVVLNLTDPAVVLGDAVSMGEWATVDSGGSLWSFAMLSPDSLGMRVHFSEIQLPLGARIVVYNGDDANEAYGPYFGPAPGATDLWSPTVFGETVVVECYVPEGADRSAVRIKIEQATHQYVPFGKLSMAKGAGACELDVTCYSAWATTAKGVAGIGLVGEDGVFYCTGSLLADTDSSTAVPYFLSANHCILSQSRATSSEFYWLYQTSSCNGVPPDPTEVPRTTGGAQLLASSNVNSGTDFALLRLNNNASVSASYLGWASAEAGIGTATVCIHHPQGDFKRISFSDITNVIEDLLPTRPRSRFHQNTWRPNLGVTEPGSSGSPLFIESTQQIIGQLWGGPSACGVDPSDRLDYYGRFDVSFPLIEQYLDPEVILDGTIEVIKPTSANSWAKGRERRIKWGTTGNTGDTVKIDLYQGGIFSMTLKASTRNDGKWKWTIPLSLSPASNYFIRVSSVADSGIFDISDNFTIRD